MRGPGFLIWFVFCTLNAVTSADEKRHSNSAGSPADQPSPSTRETVTLTPEQEKSVYDRLDISKYNLGQEAFLNSLRSLANFSSWDGTSEGTGERTIQALKTLSQLPPEVLQRLSKEPSLGNGAQSAASALLGAKSAPIKDLMERANSGSPQDKQISKMVLNQVINSDTNRAVADLFHLSPLNAARYLEMLKGPDTPERANAMAQPAMSVVKGLGPQGSDQMSALINKLEAISSQERDEGTRQALSRLILGVQNEQYYSHSEQYKVPGSQNDYRSPYSWERYETNKNFTEKLVQAQADQGAARTYLNSALQRAFVRSKGDSGREILSEGDKGSLEWIRNEFNKKNPEQGLMEINRMLKNNDRDNASRLTAAILGDRSFEWTRNAFPSDRNAPMVSLLMPGEKADLQQQRAWNERVDAFRREQRADMTAGLGNIYLKQLPDYLGGRSVLNDDINTPYASVWVNTKSSGEVSNFLTAIQPHLDSYAPSTFGEYEKALPRDPQGQNNWQTDTARELRHYQAYQQPDATIKFERPTIREIRPALPGILTAAAVAETAGGLVNAEAISRIGQSTMVNKIAAPIVNPVIDAIERNPSIIDNATTDGFVRPLATSIASAQLQPLSSLFNVNLGDSLKADPKDPFSYKNLVHLFRAN